MSTARRPRVCFFIGPSISEAEVREAWGTTDAELELLPPVQQGDVLRLLHQPPDVIGIIDGYFFQTPAVLHKELLYALERGVRVLGASSLGALRAAELDLFGMEGVGEVYRMYKSGAIDGDDEVAVVHADAEHGFQPLTEPLASLRYNLERARARKLISARTVTALVAAAKRLPFTEHNFGAIVNVAMGVTPDECTALRHFLRDEAIDLKRADALALVRTIAERIAGKQPWPTHQPVRANRSIYLHRYQREYVGSVVDGQHVADHLVLSFLKLLSPSLPRLFRRVTLRCIAIDEAREHLIEPQPDEELLTHFRQQRGLLCNDAWTAWLHTHCLASHEITAYLQECDLEAQIVARYRVHERGTTGCAALYRQLTADVAARLGVSENMLLGGLWMRSNAPWEAPLLRESKVRGQFSRMRRWVGPLAQRNAEQSQRAELLALIATPSRLEHWAAERWNDNEPFEQAVLRRGFTSQREFLEVARIAYLAPDALLPNMYQHAELVG